MAGSATSTVSESPEVDAALVAAIADRVRKPGFDRFQAQLRSSGYCARPVRLRGEICDQHGHRVWSTDTEPDRILRKACGNRREAVCPSCAQRYRHDAYHLIAAGLRGGKGVPDSVTAHPFVFATLTAPSFGHVHTRPLGKHGKPQRCRPRRDAPICEHGVRLSCGQTHAEDDPCLGQPICIQCFDHQAAVLWNNTLGELWRRTTVYLPRHLAAVLGLTQKRLHQLVRIAYIKVAEYQARGLVHLHVVIRIDRAMPDYRKDEIRPPDARFTSRLLQHAVHAAVYTVFAPIAEDLAAQLGQQRVRWGQERDVRPVDDAGELAGYLAKYSTKSTEQAGGLLHPVDADSVETVAVSEHVRGYLRAAFNLHHIAGHAQKRRRDQERDEYRRTHHSQQSAEYASRRDGSDSLAWRARQAQADHKPVRIRLHDGTEHAGRVERITSADPPGDGPEETLQLSLAGGQSVPLAEISLIGPMPRSESRPCRDRGDPRLAANAHKLGYRGHCLTKSQRWSTTFKALRQAREQHAHEQLCDRFDVPEAQHRLVALDPERRISRWKFVGVGHLTTADAYLAAQAAVQARERRRLARESLGEHRESQERGRKEER